jgi:hypothetical protein
MCKEQNNFIEEQTVKEYGLEVVEGKVTLSWHIVNGNGPDKARKGRFIVVSDSDISTNLAFGTAYLDPLDETETDSGFKLLHPSARMSDLDCQSVGMLPRPQFIYIYICALGLTLSQYRSIVLSQRVRARERARPELRWSPRYCMLIAPSTIGNGCTKTRPITW